MLYSSHGIMCRVCFDALIPKDLAILNDAPDSWHSRSAVCTCSNLSVIWDEDLTPRLYVNDILSTQRVIVFHNGDYVEIRREILKPFSSALFTDISTFRDVPLNYQEKAKKNIRNVPNKANYC